MHVGTSPSHAGQRRVMGGGRMRFSEFLKYLIVLLLLAIVLVAVSR